MREKLTAIIITIVLLCLAALPAAANENIKVYLSRNRMDFSASPYMKSERVMVPMRDIFEALDAVVEWDSDTWSVTAEKDDVTAILAIGMDTMYVNGSPVFLDVVPELTNDKTFVPLRAVSEVFGCEVNWNEDENRVDIAYSSASSVIYYPEFGTVPDFGACFGVSVVSVIKEADINGCVYNYDINSLKSDPDQNYMNVLKSLGFLCVSGNGYKVYTKDDITVLAGRAGDIFRVIVYSD